MNSKTESSNKLEVDDNQRLGEDAAPMFIYHKNNYNVDDAGIQYAYEREFEQGNKSWYYAEKPTIVYKEEETTSKEEVIKHLDDEEYDEASPIVDDSVRLQFHTLKPEERRAIIEQLREYHNEAKMLMIKNKFLHKKYINLIRNSPSLSSALDRFDECLIFEDPRYQQSLDNYGNLRHELNEKRKFLTEAFESLKENYILAKTKYKDNFENLMLWESSVARKIVPRKLSKHAWLEEVDRLLENQRRRMSYVYKIRLAYLRLHHRFENSLAKLKTFDNLGPGFSMIDYEILLKKKSIYSDKCEEQYESIKKYTENNLAWSAMVRHFDEEINLYDKKLENEVNNLNAVSTDNQVKYIKNIEMVKKRGIILKNIQKLKVDIGLLDNIFLLKKMESDMREITALQKRADALQLKISQDEKKQFD